MLSYSKIVKQAFQITISHPILWLFGLFVAGGFNLNFLHFQNIPARKLQSGFHIQTVIIFLENHPGTLAVLSSAVLVLALFSLVVTNWSRVMLVFMADSVIKTKHPELSEQWQKSKSAVWPVIKISVFTAALMVLVAAALFGPAFFMVSDPELQTLFLTGAALIFLPMAFTISCINIFTSFYIILFKRSVSSALNLGTDFFVSNWSQIFGLTVVLMVVYFVSFIIGVSLITIIHEFLKLFLELLLKFNILAVSATIITLHFLSELVLWLLLAGLNVFINTALLLLFLELITPVKAENGLEAEKEALAPATSL